MDFRVRSLARKSNTKILIIQAIDRQVDLDDLADSLGLDFPDFISELETIVEAGTKIDINYFINDILDEEQLEDMIDYFKSCTEDNPEKAIKELGSDYDEDDIRLVRVKFISDMGN